MTTVALARRVAPALTAPSTQKLSREKKRLALAKLLFHAPNLLVLDEPTNHLDLTTKRALVRALSGYEGTILFVSHDRAFLRALATRVLELSQAGPHVYPGSYGEYVSSTGHEAPGMRAG